jgi:predicted ATPase
VELEPVRGRKLIVERADSEVCVFEFGELMEAVMGDTDYRAICKNFRAIFITNMRSIGRNERNIANRLIKLFDEAYYRHVKVYVLADTPLEQLIVPPEVPQNEEDFALVRCHSRLIEFQTKSYKEKPSYCETEEAIEQ